MFNLDFTMGFEELKEQVPSLEGLSDSDLVKINEILENEADWSSVQEEIFATIENVVISYLDRKAE